MLDAQTKARIDSARDILVGKVPDQKSQVEQITIALIYKFMDDMDRQSRTGSDLCKLLILQEERFPSVVSLRNSASK